MKTISSSYIEGTIIAPPSKSGMIRAVGASLLANGTSKILNPTFCDDAVASLNIADAFGADIKIKTDQVIVQGHGGPLESSLRRNNVNCHESGLCMRMFTPIAGLADEEVVLDGSGSLLKRPMNMDEVMNNLGAQCKARNGFAPVRVKGTISGGNLTFKGVDGSQFLTGLLMALPLCSRDSTIEVTHLKSRPYVAMTVNILARFGIEISNDMDMKKFFIKGDQRYKPSAYSVEGDWSGASFMLVAGAVGGSITVKGLNGLSHQADRAIIEALEEVGAQIALDENSITVRRGKLKAFQFDATECPDLFPPLIALAAHCEGKSTIYGAERLIHKESNRALTLISEFAKLGAEIELHKDKMEVKGAKLKGALVSSHNDHRIAMACAVASISAKGEVTIDRPTCVFKSYPTFFEDLDNVRGNHE
jgi:3-phosphoshikimate 1-carboxyvinyltransferase